MNFLPNFFYFAIFQSANSRQCSDVLVFGITRLRLLRERIENHLSLFLFSPILLLSLSTFSCLYVFSLFVFKSLCLCLFFSFAFLQSFDCFCCKLFLNVALPKNCHSASNKEKMATCHCLLTFFISQKIKTG